MAEKQHFDYKDVFSESEKKRASGSLWYYSWIRFKRNKLAMAGLVLVCLLILIAATAQWISPFDPIDQTLEYATKPSGFTGNVLVRKTPDGTDYVPIQQVIRASNDSVYYRIITGKTRLFPKASLTAKMKANGINSRSILWARTGTAGIF
jgi:ABC-type dipeptide/oligopeptide/nickel transport system permease subunit